MTKKISNRKNVAINLRNRNLNTYYRSTIKTLLKKIKTLILEINPSNQSQLQDKVREISRNLTSKMDKAVKKGVYKKNTVSRKKSMVSELLKRNSLIP